MKIKEQVVVFLMAANHDYDKDDDAMFLFVGLFLILQFAFPHDECSFGTKRESLSGEKKEKKKVI